MEIIKISREGEIDNQYSELKICPEIQTLIEGIRVFIEDAFTPSTQTLTHLNRVIEYNGKKYQIEVK
ncbi:MAG: hypothetical protein PHS49_01830 [Candidatus Gracilibacteria bacterium]|nr:hypothetical protein [Candidatus Gracilibacteria bacterium]